MITASGGRTSKSVGSEPLVRDEEEEGGGGEEKRFLITNGVLSEVPSGQASFLQSGHNLFRVVNH